eukprot:Lankesteria_metandrocarpae@DN4786_c1_g1_i4.p1
MASVVRQGGGERRSHRDAFKRSERKRDSLLIKNSHANFRLVLLGRHIYEERDNHMHAQTNSASNLLPYCGDQSNLIDRWDARAVLDPSQLALYTGKSSQSTASMDSFLKLSAADSICEALPQPSSSSEQQSSSVQKSDIEECPALRKMLNYERYRPLVEAKNFGVSETAQLSCVLDSVAVQIHNKEGPGLGGPLGGSEEDEINRTAAIKDFLKSQLQQKYAIQRDLTEFVSNASAAVSAGESDKPADLGSRSVEDAAIRFGARRHFSTTLNDFASREFGISNYAILYQFEYVQQMVDAHQGMDNELLKLERLHPGLVSDWRDQQSTHLGLIDAYLEKVMPPQTLEAYVKLVQSKSTRRRVRHCGSDLERKDSSSSSDS